MKNSNVGPKRRQSQESTRRRSSSSKSLSSGSFHFVESPEDAQEAVDRLDYVLVSAIGSISEVTVKSGSKYRGLLAAPEQSSRGVAVVLSNAELVYRAPEDTKAIEFYESLAVSAEDLLALDTDCEFGAPAKAKFMTDTDISGKQSVKECELKKWVPESTEELQFEEHGSWDQFAVNEAKFGVQNTYNEHYYTTKIDTSVADYDEKLARASKLAAEIEQQDTMGSAHIAEERGHVVEGISEEDKYSGVDRRGESIMAALRLSKSPGTNKPETKKSETKKYVPPSQRFEGDDPAILSSKKKDSHSLHKERSQKESRTSQTSSLKEFSEKFKVPYKVPQETLPLVGEIKEQAKEKTASPVKKPTKLNVAAASFTPGAAFTPGSSYTSKVAPPRKKATAASFFGDKVPKETPKKNFRASFNMFVHAKETADPAKPYFVERAYQTPPTWPYTTDEPHSTLFPDLEAVLAQQMRFMPSFPPVPPPVAAMPGAGPYFVPGMMPMMPPPHVMDERMSPPHYMPPPMMPHMFSPQYKK